MILVGDFEGLILCNSEMILRERERKPFFAQINIFIFFLREKIIFFLSIILEKGIPFIPRSGQQMLNKKLVLLLIYQHRNVRLD
ncbi:hypothetical protein RIR_jg21388.t1 [Rhizophagus irregularis DAOM 181602=DAOM 197198]|nr:hypothetical protein RIR_jg21388.t1 [Rhizophagus irregularis DAOM 181602=DAOM 197198]